MDIAEIPGFIREKVLNGQYEIKLHALQRINERGILPSEIKEALLECSVVEDYPDDKRGHSCLLWGKTREGNDLHLVCGLTDETVWVITIYEPDMGKWETPLRRRAER
jgi:hypothetical protein